METITVLVKRIWLVGSAFALVSFHRGLAKVGAAVSATKDIATGHL